MIAVFAAVDAGFAFARQAYLRAVVDSRRNLDGEPPRAPLAPAAGAFGAWVGDGLPLAATGRAGRYLNVV